MNTKLIENSGPQFPAGIFSGGIEAFWYRNEKWVIVDGQVIRFDGAPHKVRQEIADAFLRDKKNQQYMEKQGITKFSEAFDRWYRCIIGGLDHVPDLLNGKLTPDVYNNCCNDLECADRGKFCGRAVGLKGYEVQTLLALKQGESIERTAAMVCISVPGMKSRIEHAKEKLHAPNMASLMAVATGIGI